MKFRRFKRKNIIKNKELDFEVLICEVDDEMTFKERVAKFEEYSRDPAQHDKIFTELGFTDTF